MFLKLPKAGSKLVFVFLLSESQSLINVLLTHKRNPPILTSPKSEFLSIINNIKVTIISDYEYPKVFDLNTKKLKEKLNQEEKDQLTLENVIINIDRIGNIEVSVDNGGRERKKSSNRWIKSSKVQTSKKTQRSIEKSLEETERVERILEEIKIKKTIEDNGGQIKQYIINILGVTQLKAKELLSSISKTGPLNFTSRYSLATKLTARFVLIVLLYSFFKLPALYSQPISSYLNKTPSINAQSYHPRQLIIKFNQDDISPETKAIQMASKASFLSLDYPVKSIDPIIPEPTKDAEESRFLQRSFMSSNEKIENRDVYLLEFEVDVDIKEAAERYSDLSNVAYAEPNYKGEFLFTPNDTYYDQQWALQSDKLNTEDAWDTTEGEGVIVAVLDSGIDLNHPDLKENIFVNEDEISNNGIDDDGNGYVDDVWGWDFADKDNAPDDMIGHGTHVSGIITATGNNSEGIIGVSPKSKLMPLKIGGVDSFFVSDAIEAIDYAVNNGAGIMNFSWSISENSQSLEAAVNYAHSQGVVMVAAAGNDAGDAMSISPANLENVITVAASDSNDNTWFISNKGAKIDVCAPGVNIISTVPSTVDLSNNGTIVPVTDEYARASGTSMAAPQVTAIAALIKSVNPDFTPEEIRQVIRVSSDDISSEGWDTESGYGRVNAFRALTIESPVEAQVATPDLYELYKNPDQNIEIRGTASGDNFVSYRLEYAPINDLYTNDNQISEWVVFKDSSSISVDNNLLGVLDTSSLSEGLYTVRLLVTNIDGKTFEDKTFFGIFTSIQQEGFPVEIAKHPTIPVNFYPAFADPVVATLDEQVTIVGSAKGLFAVYEDGTKKAAQRLEELSPAGRIWDGGSIYTPSAVGKIFNNGSQGMVAFVDGNRYLVVWDENLKIKDYELIHDRYDGVASKDYLVTPRKITPPVIVDANNDGKDEIYIGTVTVVEEAFVKEYYRVYAYEMTNQGLRKLWEYDAKAQVTSLSAANINNDPLGHLEIVASFSDGRAVILNHRGVKQQVLSDVSLGYDSRITLGDLNQDGWIDLVWTRWSIQGASFVSNIEVMLNKNGKLEAEWVKTVNTLIDNSVTLTDLEEKGALDILVASIDDNQKVYGLDYKGNDLEGFPIDVGESIYSDLVVGDVNGDKSKDIVGAGASGKVYIWDNKGKLINTLAVPLGTRGAPFLTDIDSDQDTEIGVFSNEGFLNVFDLDTPFSPETFDWPQARGNKQHTGLYNRAPEYFGLYDFFIALLWVGYDLDAQNFLRGFDLEYSYTVDEGNSWSSWAKRNFVLIPQLVNDYQLSGGKHLLKVRIKDKFGAVSLTQDIEFFVLPEFCTVSNNSRAK